ncbi:MAG: MBL fold metallo-hydrolase [Desulfomonile tiedjei]|nr:MBL fold metallo-hydrolase [Desulfomonile tiedjei]
MIETSCFDGVTQIKMSRGGKGRIHYWVSAYLVDGVLIDTGCSHCAKEFVDYLEGTDVRVAVNTHYHEDHVGANKLLQERLGIEILAHPQAIPLIKRPPALPSYREITWGNPEPSEVNPVPRRIETSRFCFDVIETPGHCEDHISLVESSRGWCFTGDLYFGEKLKTAGRETDITAMMHSMKKILELGTENLMLFTALRTVEKRGQKALRAAINYFETLGMKAKDLQERGLDVSAIVDELMGGESMFCRQTAGHFSSANLVRLLLDADLS